MARLFTVVALAVVMSASAAGPGVTQQQWTWSASRHVDPLTDEVSNIACASTGPVMLCGSFTEKGLLLTVNTNDAHILGSQLPAMRVNKNPFIPSPDIPALKRATSQTWLAQERPADGRWDLDETGLLAQIKQGHDLALRIYLADDTSVDVAMTLAHACWTLEKVMLPGDSLGCEPQAMYQRPRYTPPAASPAPQ